MNDFNYAERVKKINPAISQDLIAKVRALRADGVEVIDFSDQGASPAVARQAAIQKINMSSGSSYSDTRGLSELRYEIARKMLIEQKIEVNPETEVLVTVGAKEAILSALLTLADHGDEVLVEDPGYLGFEPIIRLAGAKPIRVPLIKESGFRFPVEGLRHYITARTKVLLLCNPHNPGGYCLTKNELTEIGKIAKENGLTILVDEAYEHFVFDGRKHISLASLPGMESITITIQTMSKIFNMGGWRIGWAIGPTHLIKKMHLVHTHAITAPTTFSQSGAAAALSAGIAEGNQPIANIVERYEAQRDAMIEGLASIPGLSCHVPHGTFFVFPNISRFKAPPNGISDFLLKIGHVATVPGSAFGPNGSEHIRMVFKCDKATIQKGIARMADAFGKLEYQ